MSWIFVALHDSPRNATGVLTLVDPQGDLTPTLCRKALARLSICPDYDRTTAGEAMTTF